MKILDYLKDNLLYLDGGMGTLLQASGLGAGELPERLNINCPEIIEKIHYDYFAAGSNIVVSNTFGANSLKFSDGELESIIKSALKNADNARKRTGNTDNKWIALDIGPLGKMLKPLGDLDFETAVEIFAKTVKLGAKYGADLVFIETMNDSYETKAALLAAKENCELPVFVSNAYSENGKLMTGAEPAAMVTMLEGLGADAVGVNCSFGPEALKETVREYLKYSSLPVIFKPNAGLPAVFGGKTVYDVLPEDFAETVTELIKEGVRIAGGCCGTTPEYIKELKKLSENILPKAISKKDYTAVSSYTHAVFFGNKPILIGERINPTGKKRFKEALKENDIGYILKEGIREQESGADILDVNVGLPEIDEAKMLETAVCELQAVSDLPLQIDTSDIFAMETALRRYNGKAMINSVNGKKETMDAVFPLAKKYGGLLVALTLDENGIPEHAEQRLEIAEKILKEAEKYGIRKNDIIFDPLAMTVSADKNAAKETLKAVKLITEKLGCHTSLGVSNVSFGLPSRDIINGEFFTLSLANGLSAAIMNPYSAEMMKAYYSYCALSGLDANCLDYIDFAGRITGETSVTVSADKKETNGGLSLQEAVIKGLKADARAAAEKMLETADGLEIVNKEIIPALDTIGKGFENKTVYLPQLLMSAEAAGEAFEAIKSKSKGAEQSKKLKIVIATVKGDIHDIGKNIVKLLLENYGFSVTDLGKDVPPEDILEKVLEIKADLLGLSALMTTTVPSMEETVKLIKEKASFCKTVVGGAVLNKEIAGRMGADMYSKDAMETVRYAESLEKQ